MTAATISHAPRRAASRRSNLRWLVSDVAVLTRRILARIVREPETLSRIRARMGYPPSVTEEARELEAVYEACRAVSAPPVSPWSLATR